MKKIINHKHRIASLVVVAVLVGLVGVGLQLLTRAATPTVTVEVEGSTLTGGAQAVTDTAASGGKAILFDAPPAPPTGTALVNTNFDALPVSSPMSLTNFRLAMNDPVVNGNLAVASVRSEAGRGNYMRVTLPANQIGGGSGMSSIPKLKQSVDEASVLYDVRFADNFVWSLGGKLPGLGGAKEGISPGIAAGCAAGTGDAWSGRGMWGAPKVTGGGGSWTGYMYNLYKVHACGDGVTTGKNFTLNKWHTIKQYYKMNTISSNGTPNADGIHRMWFDGVQVVDANNVRYRNSNSLHITHMFWAIFRGGSTPDWGAPTPGSIDIDNLLVKTPS